MRRDLSILHGKHLWVWYVDQSGGVDGLIQTTRDIGARGVLIKCADGTTPWAQFAQSVAALKAAGLVVGAWAYVYPTDVDAQAETIISASQGADYLVIDAESEFETPGTDVAATQLGQRLRVLAPDLVMGLTTFAIPRYHRAFPYLDFTRWADFVAPQVYWADAGMSPEVMLANAIHGLEGYGLPLYPIGQGYSPSTPADVAAFAAYCAQKWIEGVSWWDVQSMTPELRAAIAQTQVYAPVAKPHVAPVPAHGLDAKQDATVAEIEKLAEELKHE